MRLGKSELRSLQQAQRGSVTVLGPELYVPGAIPVALFAPQKSGASLRVHQEGKGRTPANVPQRLSKDQNPVLCGDAEADCTVEIRGSKGPRQCAQAGPLCGNG